jgi:thiamine-monophosphate kinase
MGGRGITRGIGDDCAVLRVPAGHEALITTDFSLEGVHFRRDWHTPESVGHRCLTRGLSDIAAMGGEPIAAFLSMALPPDVPQEWVDGFLSGFLKLARKFGVALAGGDTAQSPVGAVSARRKQGSPDGSLSLSKTSKGSILADVVVLGAVPRGKAVLRSGAKVGDDIFVTGTLGGSAAVIEQLYAGGRRLSAIGKNERAHYFPVPRLAVAEWLRERGLASAMIDISDGLSTDLSHICEESKVGAWIAEQAIPVAAEAMLEHALNGGDDYELLFTASPAKHDRIPDRIAGVPIRWLGTITKKNGMWLVAPDMKSRKPLEPHGWEHFRK